jgi:micrococcal nuclease
MKNFEQERMNVKACPSSFCDSLPGFEYTPFVKPNIVYICAITGLLFWIVLAFTTRASAMDAYHVNRVVDGDTLFLTDNTFVRYIGINAPEMPRGNKAAEPYGIEAKIENERLVKSGTIFLVFGREKRDRYGRGLAYVYTSENVFVNQRMLEQGWAYYLFKPPNLRYHDLFLKAQQQAMKGQQGMWRGWKATALSLVGNKRSRRFHRTGCASGMQTAKSNRILFSGLWEAFWKGYAPCKKCFPKGPFP